MTEERHRLFDTLIKLVGVIGTIFSFIWGVNVHLASGEKALQAELIARDRTFAEELFKRRLDDYEAIALAAGSLSVPSSDEAELLADIRNFERLYWSTISTVESSEVVHTMDYLRKGTENYLNRKTSFGDNSPEDQLKVRSHLLVRSIQLAIKRDKIALAKVSSK